MVHHTVLLEKPLVRRPGKLSGARLRLEPAAALARHAAAIADLAGRCRQPNPFFLPEFLGPAIEALGRGAIELALVADGAGRLISFAPISSEGLESRLFAAARIWTHPYAPLGVPLIDPAHGEAAAAALVDGLAQAGRRVLVLPDVPLAPPAWRRSRASSFVASAGSVTPFHADYEENLFLHLAGPKVFHLFDNSDRSFVSEADLETFPGKHRNLAYEESFHARGQHHEMRPGDGLYVPYAWPHWVETGDGHAVSIAVTWKNRAVRRHNALLFMNAVLRRIGLPQPAPGRRPLWDAAKIAAYRPLRLAAAPLIKAEALRRALRAALFGRKANYFYRRGGAGA